MLHIAGVLSQGQIAEIRRLLDGADWIDGRATAGYLSQRVKNNRQLPEDSPAARAAGEIVLAALQATPLFISAALPARIVPPLFNRYEGDESYGAHVDGAVRPTGGVQVRTDLSATLFLADPQSYEGGELVVTDDWGDHPVKLAAGDLFLYPSTGVHHVRPVTSGVRLAAFFWVQSLIRDNWRRQMLFDLDTSIQSLAADAPDHPSLTSLMAHYHNLLRQWAEP